ncbi:MAG: enoyl-CoA hydratase/isomerase family protein [Desulfobacterales bacterium]|nr:enoyl-CoA hydratase/isomerase family protein [Desulfobacterales bacterium]
MPDQRIAIERRGYVAIVTLNRPNRLNAFDQAMFVELEQAAAVLATESPRAVVITGAGERAFTAGFDVNPDNPMVAALGAAIEAQDRSSVGRAIRVIRRAVDRFAALPMPLIAAVNGKAFGGGAELAVRCDLRVMDPAAVLCFSEVRLGLMPDWGGGAMLAALVGPARAADLILTARECSAAEALDLGVVNRISAPGQALAAALDLAQAIAANGPRAVRSALAVIRHSREQPLSAALDEEEKRAVELILAGECLQGIGAHLSGRAPVFADE